ncbi:kinase-like domain-containing protein [Rhizophagus irregularis DAOM 181602=DAOM 197198]|nr:kinase-like domain-containing protein [Rhizophagus irregularis DAOM 181602=DAOM 197198]
METFEPEKIVEWIPYDNLQNIKYLTKGGFSEIYTAVWNDGRYYEWDSTKQQLTRFGIHDIVLRRLENVGSADQSWFEEAKSHLTITTALKDIHEENAIHRDLHSGNILFDKIDQRLFISDLGFCGPADKSQNSIYGNLPYIAPELRKAKETCSLLFTSSKIHNFENFLEPRNATEEEQEAFHSKSYDDLYIPDSTLKFGQD